MTVAEAIKKALLLIGVADKFGEPSANEYSDGITTMNQLLKRLGVDSLGVHEAATVTHTMVVGDASYTIGSTGNIVATRPHKIATAKVTIGSTDYNITEISRDDYDRIPDKTTRGIPVWFFYDPTYANGTLYFYPAPDTAYTLSLQLHQPITEYTSTTQTINLPKEYTSHLPWGMAVDIAPEYGREAPRSVQAMAAETLRQLKRIHSTPANKVSSDPFMRSHRPYDIIAGE